MENKIPRREFLTFGSAAVVGPVLLGEAPLPVGREVEARFVSMGYWRGGTAPGGIAPDPRGVLLEEASGDDAHPFRPDVIPAKHVPARAVALDAVRMTLHGVYEAAGALFRPATDAVSVDAHFRVEGEHGPATVPFAVWHSRRSPVRSGGSRVRFRMPVDPRDGLLLTVERSGLAHGVGAAVESLLTRGDRGSAIVTRRQARFEPGLRPGVYFLAAPGGVAGSEPAWERYQFREGRGEDGSARRILVRRSPLGLEAADFDYVVVELETPTSV